MREQQAGERERRREGEYGGEKETGALGSLCTSYSLLRWKKIQKKNKNKAVRTEWKENVGQGQTERGIDLRSEEMKESANK